MSPNNVCPSCGAALEENVGNACPFCGSALGVSSSAPTIIATPKKRKAAESSAAAMDEIKKLVDEGNTAAAEEFASVEFGLDKEAAEGTVEQVSFDMKHSSRKAVAPEPAPASKPSEPVIESSPVDEPKKPSNSRNLIIGGVVAAVFLCCCCCLPIVIAIATMMRNR